MRVVRAPWAVQSVHSEIWRYLGPLSESQAVPQFLQVLLREREEAHHEHPDEMPVLPEASHDTAGRGGVGMVNA